jgi:glycerol-3-phosphate O-acyltransferase
LRKLDAHAERSGLLRTVAIAGRYVLKQVAYTLMGRRFRFGYACVNFGKPVSMRKHVRDAGVDFRALTDNARRERVAEVGAMLMAHIGHIVPVLPVPLVAAVFMRDPLRALTELELKAEVLALMQQVEARGAHVYVPRTDRDYALTVGLRILSLRRLVIERDGLFAPNLQELPVLAYYANSIAHLNPPQA